MLTRQRMARLFAASALSLAAAYSPVAISQQYAKPLVPPQDAQTAIHEDSAADAACMAKCQDGFLRMADMIVGFIGPEQRRKKNTAFTLSEKRFAGIAHKVVERPAYYSIYKDYDFI